MAVDLTKPTLNVVEAAELLRVGRTAAYELIRTGGFPVEVLRLGPRIIRIPTARLLDLLGIPGCGSSAWTTGGSR